MVRNLSAITIIGLLFFQAVNAQQDDVSALMQRNACTGCHQPTVRTVGPSWQEVAERYRDGSKTAAQLGERIRKGGSGAWGAVPMPPQAQLSQADLENIAAWILANH
ncbi:c-type cytochrome [Zestomonas carbonaria]|uniref:Cytochrome c-551 n=1 Tax=Zestomonas carbonaria TaxID=2762745 RepID=A0A7U7I7A3_9GAMM|nr:c-type cytochrome [Pseudomonas carbonaria]CAD5105896.1 hypothetical protein PSEWESI4_00153 [Pseudomonas carbonaria]